MIKTSGREDASVILKLDGCVEKLFVQQRFIQLKTDFPIEEISRPSRVVEYAGEFIDGQGTMVWENGVAYTGRFKDYLPHGLGTMTNSKNRKYEGSFHRGWVHGEGVFTDINGRVFQVVSKHGIIKESFERESKVLHPPVSSTRL